MNVCRDDAVAVLASVIDRLKMNFSDNQSAAILGAILKLNECGITLNDLDDIVSEPDKQRRLSDAQVQELDTDFFG